MLALLILVLLVSLGMEIEALYFSELSCGIFDLLALRIHCLVCLLFVVVVLMLQISIMHV